MSQFFTLDDFDLKGKRVLVRADLNVPMHDGAITDMTRIDRVAPTLCELMDKGAKVIVMSHFGRPNGKMDARFSLHPVVRPLSDALYGTYVTFVPDCVGKEAQEAVDAMEDGQVVLLENLRFHPGEQANEKAFAKELSKLADLYVNDAFSAAHRSHASVEGIPKFLPSAIGRLMEAELANLDMILSDPKRPIMAIVGGAKVSTKLSLLENLIPKVEKLAVAGGIAHTLMASQGQDIGRSICEPDMIDVGKSILENAQKENCDLILPVDGTIAASTEPGEPSETVDLKNLPADAMILDLGEKSVHMIMEKLEDCQTVLWNGPLGLTEVAPFDAGTKAIAKRVAELTKEGKLQSVAGGGDTVAALTEAGCVNDFTYVSMGGGAFLKWLQGRSLPGFEALAKKEPLENISIASIKRL
ncbi:MAG: phosphoglycerate kinase [Alphaproteobacteria bacterium]|jgi:phosphoglycerate kinase|nr:phosphoglycerate kinase [Alphaproteobacteria bacterium]MBT5389637.1 phosphoglycerate kinase [Alphaproteobacteria bacterium]MBT5655074.1 phosphoglycerate kinase [Alphaproteobacteria bacterium]